LDWLDNLEYSVFGIPRPDLNIFLYVDPETSRNLALKVEKLNMDKSKDIHENDGNHMKHASEAFMYVAKKYNRPTVQCISNNGLRTKEDIHDELWDIVVNVI
jgi:dTMP kinase